MQNIRISELSPHPKNTEFFDDMSGEKWKEFLESIRSRGVIEPVVITPDKVIVSGHQRVRACKELGISSVICDVHTYNNEDEILQDLLETNIRQRGDIGGSAKKVGLRIKELERIYGIEHGGDRKSNTNNSVLKSQTELAAQMNISVDTLQNYKQLAEMIPELEDLVDTGIVTKSTALAIMRQLSKDEQQELIDNMDTSHRITKTKAQEHIDALKNQIVYLQKEKAELEEQLNNIPGRRDCMNELTVKNVEFLGDVLIAAQDENGIIWAGIRWFCNGLGLSKGQMQSERKRIQEDVVLSKGERNLILPTKGGNQETLCLKLDYIPLWLAKISITPSMKKNKPELVDKLIKYQLQAKDVLAKAFLSHEEPFDIPKDLPSALRLAADECEKRMIAEEKLNRANTQLQKQKPFVNFSMIVQNGEEEITMDKMAAIISKNGFSIGRNNLFKFLRDEKILKDNNIPYRNYIKQGLFKVIETTKETHYGLRTYITTLITGKGQIYITKKIMESDMFKETCRDILSEG